MPRNFDEIFKRAPTAALLLLALSFLLICSSTLAAQEKSKGVPKPGALFKSSETLNVTLTAPWREIVRNEKNQNPYPAKIGFTDELGNDMTLDMKVSRRGLTRQKVCDFPPIKLYFEKKEVKGTTFRGQKALKMVTHCDKSKRFEQYYIMEMLAYQMYNLITDYSFRVRPLNVNYVDSKTGKIEESRFAFLIEDDSDVAKRHDLKKLNIAKIKVSQLDPVVTSEFSMFQYMIANVDWAALSGPKTNECCHNAKLIGPEPLKPQDKAYPIPYDFDSAGLINAHYAAPPAGLPIRKVTQRLYRGYCKQNSALEAARKRFLAEESAIYSLINNESRLNSNTQKKAVKYIGRFFKTIKNPKDFERLIVQKCR